MTRTVRHLTTVTLALAAALTWVPAAHAAGAVNISSCQTLSIPNTVYKLTTNLVSCDDCLVVGADKITIDLQGHSISATCPGGVGAAINDQGATFDGIIVKNGSVSGYMVGVWLPQSTRASVLGVTATDNRLFGIDLGSQGLVKSSEASGSRFGIAVADRGQVQQCNAHHNRLGIGATGHNCLITMNTATLNDEVGIDIRAVNKCTVSYNTASNNGTFIPSNAVGIRTVGTGHLVTHNVALNNTDVDFAIVCPSTVTFNDSTNGFPASYDLNGTGCHTANND